MPLAWPAVPSSLSSQEAFEADSSSVLGIYREEMFAPVFSFLTYKTEEEAIFIANDHECQSSGTPRPLPAV